MYQRENLEWRQVPGEEYYYVSNYGDIARLEHENISSKGQHFLLKQRTYWVEEQCCSGGLHNQAYPTVKINGRNQYSHRLAALAFIPNPNNKPFVNHKDGNTKNNYVGCALSNYEDSNLEWVTAQENVRHAYDNGLMVPNSDKKREACRKNIKRAQELAVKMPVIQLDLEGNFIAEHESIKGAARAAHVNKWSLWELCHHQGAHRSVGHYLWIFKNEYDPNKDYHYENHQSETSRHPVVQYDLDNNFIAEYPSVSEACRANGWINNGSIGSVCVGKRPQYKNYIWRYKESV